MVYFDISGTGNDGKKLATDLLEQGIKILPVSGGKLRFVTNYWVSKEDVLKVVSALKLYLK